ncbi:hypothetical protein [Brachybacterium paraconglomeratum]|uniref:hypothetical protein n=1 Tax=Brachybacterium paraconglomeratum TaxID=173362 RepID=UPI0022AF5875|nr:hypothetical protein [Brachybacterium paraconglomeratum]MCZ4324758.1 hypothetical protein [Brachybacterium paraconglomeratum]
MARRAVVQPSVKSLAELRAAALALRAADKEMRRAISKGTRDAGNVIWREEIGRAATSKMDRLVLVKGARIKAGNPAQAIAASSRRPLEDGLIPDRDYAGFEFGTRQPDARETYTRRSRSGGSHKVTRRTHRQLPRPPRQGTGRVAYAAWSRTGPRLVSLWTQTVFRIVYDAFGEK